jgi:hypothetical protein
MQTVFTIHGYVTLSVSANQASKATVYAPNATQTIPQVYFLLTPKVPQSTRHLSLLLNHQKTMFITIELFISPAKQQSVSPMTAMRNSFIGQM